MIKFWHVLFLYISYHCYSLFQWFPVLCGNCCRMLENINPFYATGLFLYPWKHQKTKKAILKTEVTYLCVSGVKKCSFFGKFGVLFFLVISVLRFSLLVFWCFQGVWKETREMKWIKMKGRLVRNEFVLRCGPRNNLSYHIFQ